MRKKAVQNEAPSSSVAEDVVAKEKTKAPVSGLAGMMGSAQPAPVQAPQPTMMAEGGLASLPVKDDLYPEEFAMGGMVAFADGGDVPGFAEGMYIPPLGYDPASQYRNARQYEIDRALKEKYNPSTQGIFGGEDLLSITERERKQREAAEKAGIVSPYDAAIKYYGENSPEGKKLMERRAAWVSGRPDPYTGAPPVGSAKNVRGEGELGGRPADKKQPDLEVTPNPPAADKRRPVKVDSTTIAPSVDVPARRTVFEPQPERSIGDYAKELSDYLGPDTARAEGLARIAKMEEQAQKQKDMAPWMALAEAGLGIAAGSSPFALQNIGAGAIQGVKSYGAAQKEYQTQLEKANALRNEVAKAERAEKVAIGKFGADSKEAQRERDFKERLQSEKIATEYDLERIQQEGAMARVKEQVRSAEKIAGMNIEAGRWDRAGGGVKGALTEKQIYDIREGLRDQARKEVLASPEIARLGDKQRTLPQNQAIINRAIEQRLNELVNREIQGISASRNPSDANTINPLGNMSYSALLGLTGGTK
jgi:hypothetical protein